MVADHMKHRERKILEALAIVFPQTHVVVHHVAQANAVYRTVGDRRGELLHVFAHILVNVNRMEHVFVRSRGLGADLRIGRHQNRIPIARAGALHQRKIGLELLLVFGNPLPELGNSVLRRNFITGRNRDEHEPTKLQVAEQLPIAFRIGFSSLHAVTDKYARYRFAVVVLNRTIERGLAVKFSLGRISVQIDFVAKSSAQPHRHNAPIMNRKIKIRLFIGFNFKWIKTAPKDHPPGPFYKHE